MSIANELSSDVAIAILAARGKSSDDLRQLKEIVMKVHTTLQEMVAEERRHRRYSNATGTYRLRRCR